VTKKEWRRTPPIWVWILILIPLALMVWMRMADSIGDQGVTNVNSFLLVVLAGLIASIWFIFFSGHSRIRRYGYLLAVIVIFVAFFSLVRYEGVSGNMIPKLSFGSSEGAGLEMVPEGGPPAGVPSGVVPVDLGTTTATDFPGFLGPRRDATLESVRLARDWESRAPELVWRQPIGAGWSAFSVVNGVAVTMEQRGDRELVTAYDVKTGELLWSHSDPGDFDHFLGGAGPRSTPTIHEGLVYTLGASGRLLCLGGATGEVVWEKDLLEEYGVTPAQELASIQYGRSNSALVTGDLLVIPAGGNKGGKLSNLTAYDRTTGDRIWEGSERQISFSSPRLTMVAGVEQILIVNEDTLSGHDPAGGRMLWEHPWPGVTSANASVSQAVPVPPDRVFVSKGYGGGAALLQLFPQPDGRFDVKEIWANSRVLRTKFTNVVIRDGHIYGLSDGILECVEMETGERVWKRGRYQHGQILLVGDLLLVLAESGELVLVEPTPDEPDKVLGRFQAVEGKTWNNFALYGDLLLVRNSQEAAAYRLPLATMPGEPGAGGVTSPSGS
jgi:outer membrane protein assembly factor BamB